MATTTVMIERTHRKPKILAIAASSTFTATGLWRVLAVAGVVLLAGFLVAPIFCQASEDAIILFQYSANLAHSGVISYIPNGPRAEGATDFLWMLYIAVGRAAGIPSYGLAIATTAGYVVLVALMLLRVARQRFTFWNIGAVVCLLLLAPQIFAAEAGFGVFPFALFLGTMAAAAYKERYGWAVAGGLLLCLIRPDGVVFAVPLLAVYLFRGEGVRSRGWKLVAGFIVPGLAYFIWRWHYFGHLLPLPFYVKSDTARVCGFLVVRSAESLAAPLLASCAVLWIALRRDILLRRNLVLFATLIVPSSLFYMTMRLDQDYANRFFFYPLMVMAILLAGNYKRFQHRQRTVLLGGLGVWAVLLAYFWINWLVIYTLEYPQPQEVAVARELNELPVRGSMIVSESGAIPFYSQWIAYDPWGLNTPAFATRLIQPADVNALHPDLIILHPEAGPVPCVVPAEGTPAHSVRSWQNMTDNVIAGIAPGEYTQWLLPQYNGYYRTHPLRWNRERRWGNEDYQCWFIHNSYPLNAEVMEILKRHGGISAADYVAAHETKEHASTH